MSESKTPHGPGCWEDPEHGECARIQARAAINHIHEQQKEIASLIVERDALAARVEKAEARVRVLPEPVGYISTGTYYWLVRGKADPASIYGTGSISAHKTDKYANPVYMEPNDAALSREEKS